MSRDVIRLVLEKNNRTVCVAKKAGYVEHHELPGKVKTGCMNTPLQASTFCSLHKPREIKVESESSIYGLVRGAHNQVIESIIQQKQTRNGSYYQVSNLLAVCVDGDNCIYVDGIPY